MAECPECEPAQGSTPGRGVRALVALCLVGTGFAGCAAGALVARRGRGAVDQAAPRFLAVPQPVANTTAAVVPKHAVASTAAHDVRGLAGSHWITGTWTTGYWDCCKPSCSWPGKGRVNRPVFACHAHTGHVLHDAKARSVCNGGHASACHSHQPFLANENVALGFAAAAVSGSHGLTGDENCGQCYELRFVQAMHDGGVWGGAHPELVNKSMVLQVINIGYDVQGSHSFDIQIPGAGQGAFPGCAQQYPGFNAGDFDCDRRYGGCDMEAGCSRLPGELQRGCRWRFRWLHWLRHMGQSNNPWVHFRRVRCPRALVDITGSTPTDDHQYPAARAHL